MGTVLKSCSYYNYNLMLCKKKGKKTKIIFFPKISNLPYNHKYHLTLFESTLVLFFFPFIFSGNLSIIGCTYNYNNTCAIRTSS